MPRTPSSRKLTGKLPHDVGVGALRRQVRQILLRRLHLALLVLDRLVVRVDRVDLRDREAVLQRERVDHLDDAAVDAGANKSSRGSPLANSRATKRILTVPSVR